jgi:hypothetical protein
MKLRLEGNSIRLRVRKSDLEALQKDGTITETLTFINQVTFNYQLTIDKGATEVDAHLSNNNIIVLIPLSMAMIWITSDTVGIEATLASGLFILIEKDFPCTDRPWEDTSDTFFELVEPSVAQC